MANLLKQLIVVGLISMITGCGGGSGGSPIPATVTSTETFQLRQAYINRFVRSASLVGTYSGTLEGFSITGSATMVTGAPTPTTYEGIAALQKFGTGNSSVTANGVTIPIASSATVYADAAYVPLGSYNGVEYTVVTGAVNLPLTAKVNDTAIAYRENRYTSSSKANLLGTSETTYALFPDTSTTAILKIIDTKKDITGTFTMQSIGTYRMTPAGAITDISFSYIEPSKNTNYSVTF